MADMTRIGVQNMALDVLRQAPLANADDPLKPEGKWMGRNYETIRDVVLKSHNWNFAIKRVALTNDSSAPAFGWNYQYTLPSDCLRVLPLTYAGYYNSSELPYAVEGQKLLTNQEAPLLVRYIARIEEEGRFDPFFTVVFSLVLAKKLGPWLTGKENTAVRLDNDLQQTLAQARLADALEGTPEPVIDDEVINVRYT